MASKSPPIQELPPHGGYSKINFARVPAKKLVSGLTLFGAFVVMQFSAIWLRNKYTYPRINYRKIEMRSATMAVQPFLVAERDRAILLQMRRNREAEAELMKNVEGWEVGTYMGEPIYKTLEEDGWREPQMYEYFEHSDPKYMDTFAHCHLRR